MLIYVLALAFIALVAAFLHKRIGKRNHVQAKTAVFLVGEKGAGKTSLLYYLANKSTCIQTTNSIEPNETTIQNQLIVDIPGNNYQKDLFFSKLEQAKKIVLVIDASSVQFVAPSAQILYNILISNVYQRNRTPIMIALNKQDQEKSFKAVDFETFLSHEMEKIKRSRRAIAEQRENSNDKIRFQDSTFQLSDFSQIKVAEISVINQNTEAVQKFIFN